MQVPVDCLVDAVPSTAVRNRRATAYWYLVQQYRHLVVRSKQMSSSPTLHSVQLRVPGLFEGGSTVRPPTLPR